MSSFAKATGIFSFSFVHIAISFKYNILNRSCTGHYRAAHGKSWVLSLSLVLRLKKKDWKTPRTERSKAGPGERYIYVHMSTNLSRGTSGRFVIRFSNNQGRRAHYLQDALKKRIGILPCGLSLWTWSWVKPAVGNPEHHGVLNRKRPYRRGYVPCMSWCIALRESQYRSTKVCGPLESRNVS